MKISYNYHWDQKIRISVHLHFRYYFRKPGPISQNGVNQPKLLSLEQSAGGPVGVEIYGSFRANKPIKSMA